MLLAARSSVPKRAKGTVGRLGCCPEGTAKCPSWKPPAPPFRRGKKNSRFVPRRVNHECVLVSNKRPDTLVCGLSGTVARRRRGSGCALGDARETGTGETGTVQTVPAVAAEPDTSSGALTRSLMRKETFSIEPSRCVRLGSAWFEFEFLPNAASPPHKSVSDC